MCIDTIETIKSKAIDKPGHKEKCDAHDYVIRTFDRFLRLCMCIAVCVCVCVCCSLNTLSLTWHASKCGCVLHSQSNIHKCTVLFMERQLFA